MPFTDKAALKTALAAWIKRSGISSTADDIVKLAEAELNRVLPELITDTTLTGSVGSASISISANTVAEALGLFRIVTGVGESELTIRQDGTFPYSLVNGVPSRYAIDESAVIFDCPLDTAYTFRFRFRQRFALATDGATNWLLTDHPDTYLAACIVWGALYEEDDGKIVKWRAMLDKAIPQIKAYINRRNKGTVRVDPVLLMIGSRSVYNITTD